jgi:hypothetical protein
VHDGSALLRIESVKEGIYREGGHLPSVGGYTDKCCDREAPRPSAPGVIFRHYLR